MKSCPLCNKVHAVFANVGVRLLILSDWEQCCDESELEFQLRNQLPLHKRSSNLVSFARFMEFVN
jgi:hypothetical protein